MKKLLSILILSLLCVCCMVGFTACENGDIVADTRNPQIVGVYNTYVAYAEENGVSPLSYEEWLASIKGENGADGINGVDGKDGTDGRDGQDGKNGADGLGIKNTAIDENGNLILTMTDDSVIDAGKVKDVHPHEISEKEVIEREPTCTRVGLKYVYCGTCGEILKNVIIEKAPHDYEDIITPPTCTAQGYTTHTCKNCGHTETDTYTEIIPHDYVDTITPPTCTEQGYITHTCKDCGDSYVDTYTVADTTEHNYVKKGAIYGDCALSMKQDYICTRCNHEKTENITTKAPDAHNHLNENETCPHCGWTLYIKNGDSLLMKNSDDKLSAEFYGTTATYVFDSSLKQYIINAYIAESVSSIGDRAFHSCSSLTSITIPDSVMSIGESAFYNCRSLTNITIPDSVENINSMAFYNCQNLQVVNIGKGVINIGSAAFMCCDRLSKVNYTGTIDTWCEINFEYFNFEYEYNSSNPLYYGKNLYINDELLTNANITTAIKINDYAFHNCKSLKSIKIGNSVISVGIHVFDGCTDIQDIEDNLVYVDNCLIAIEDVNGLPPTKYNIRQGTKFITSGVFRNNLNITNISIPDSIISISSNVFAGCENLQYNEYQNGLYLGNENNPYVVLIKTKQKDITSCSINANTKIIYKSAFDNCTHLYSITIPNSIIRIENHAFYQCSALKNIYFENANEWTIYQENDINNTLTIASNDLKNTDTAATYLKSKYCYYIWTHG